MPNNNLRFYDKITKKNVNVRLTDEFKKKVFEAAGDFFPYPVIIKHNGHYTILHLDKDFNDRGTVQTKILLDLGASVQKPSKTSKKAKKKTESKSNKNKKTRKSKQSLDALSSMSLDSLMGTRPTSTKTKKTAKKKAATPKKSAKK